MEQEDTFFTICIIHKILLTPFFSVSSFIYLYLIMYFLVRRAILEVIVYYYYFLNLLGK